MQAARGASLNPSDASHPSADRQTPPARSARCLTVLASIAALGYALDLGSKTMAAARLTDRPPVPVVGDVATLYLVRNPGAAFGTGTSYTLVLTLVAVVAALAVLWTSRRLGSIGWAIGLGSLLAGILGNLTDRVFRSPGLLRGHVVDFLRLPHWPVFNVADICINIAAAVVIVQAVRGVSVNGTRSRPRSRDEAPGDPEAIS